MASMVNEQGIPLRALGKTGENVTIIGVGGYHIGKDNEQLGTHIIRAAIDQGVTFMDNAWCYNEGRSEIIMGKALRDGYRDKAFLMTKNHGRDAKTFVAQLDQSLTRLQTDHIDLIQFHEMIHDGTPAMVYAEGALEQALLAKEQGKIRYIGFTGHRWPHLFQQMLDGGFQWDTLQHPVNLLDAQFRTFSRDILPKADAMGLGIIGMKSLAAGNLLKLGVTPQQAIRYSLSQPVDVLVTGIDSMEILAQNIAIAKSFEPMSPDEQDSLLSRVAEVAADGKMEEYKTGSGGNNADPYRIH